MSSADLDRWVRRGSAEPPRWLARAVSVERLEVVSIVHSFIYTGLLVCAFALHNPQPATTLLGFGHGVLWIAISLVCIVAARYRLIPWWLAVCVAVLGGIGPFFGTVGFVLEARRRRRAGTVGGTDAARTKG